MLQCIESNPEFYRYSYNYLKDRIIGLLLMWACTSLCYWSLWFLSLVAGTPHDLLRPACKIPILLRHKKTTLLRAEWFFVKFDYDLFRSLIAVLLSSWWQAARLFRLPRGTHLVIVYPYRAWWYHLPSYNLLLLSLSLPCCKPWHWCLLL